MAKKKKERQLFYFVDTRDNAKSEEPFAIHNADVAKSWTRDYNNDEGPFKPVKEEEYQINRRDLKEADKNTVENQKEATEHNMNLVKDSRYEGMSQKELQDELTARDIEFKKSGKESSIEHYIGLLESDDIKDNE